MKTDLTVGNNEGMTGYLRMMHELQSQCNRQKVSTYGFIMQHGREWPTTSKSFPRWGEFKECFKNALEAAMLHDLVYCEGYAFSVIPTLHAWCIDPKTKTVIDPTWEKGTQYFGVPFRTKYVLEFTDRHMVYDSIVENYRDKWPLLLGTVDISTAVNPELSTEL